LVITYIRPASEIKEGFVSKKSNPLTNLRKIKKRNKIKKKPKKEDEEKEKKEEFDILRDTHTLMDVISNVGINKKRKKRKPMKNKNLEKRRKRFEKYVDSFNHGILGRRPKNMEESLQKFEKMKEKFWEIFDKKKR
tara:strand:+ start:68 stop:475 length:408 start_codon:yes stop_codon:yes gene_type:complete